MRSPPTEFAFVDDARTLGELVHELAAAEVIALDTEFVRERTFFPELCVLQVATNRLVAAIDCLASLDLEPVFDALFRLNTNWVLHSARQDLEVLFFKAGRLPPHLIDTQIAASLIGMPTQVGLQSLLEEILSIRIGKLHTRADWRRRPLTDELVDYALDDVRYLLPLWESLEQRLSSLGREQWLVEDCARQLALPIEQDVATLFERTKGAGSLTGDSRAAAHSLLAWREERAKQLDRPRRWILADDQLIRIAAHLPASIIELDRIQGLPKRLVSHSGDEILAAIEQLEPMDEPRQAPLPSAATVKSLQQEIREVASKLGIQPEVLAARRDIVAMAAGSPPSFISSGWRHGVLAHAYEKFSRDRVS